MTQSMQKASHTLRKLGRFAAIAEAQVRAACRRHGVGAPIWILASMAVISAAGLAVPGGTGPDLPTSPLEGPERDGLIARLASEADASPADAAPQLRRAYIETLGRDDPAPDALDALRRSYALEPLGPDATVWRLGFIFNHWSAMPLDLRQNAQAELEAAFPRHGWAMRDLPLSIEDPAGRMAARLLFDRLRLAGATSPEPAAQRGR